VSGSDGCAYLNAVAAYRRLLDTVPDSSPHSACHPLGLRPSGAESKQGEFVAAVSVRPVVLPGRTDDRPGHDLKKSVAGRMAARVVEGSERVEVDHEQRERLVGVDHRREVAFKSPVVPQTGEGVEICPARDGQVRLRVLQGDRGLAGEQLAQFELVLGEVASGPPTRVRLRLPTTSPWTRRGTTMMF
jgi:hypothetical protein